MGEVVWANQGLTAIYKAPDVSGSAVISVSFKSGTPTPDTAERVCEVQDKGNTAPPPTPGTTAPSADTVIISEVMGNPCGGLSLRKYNQYVELYNYGDEPVDVGGWWLYDEGESGTPDQLVAWNSRSALKLAKDLVTDSTIIPAKGVAVVLSPIYPENHDTEKMPYRFPAGVVILTAATSATLGDDYFGIIANQNGYDTVTLYIGGETVIISVVDTYGTPAITSAYPVNIDDDHKDHIPMYLGDCYSVERVDPHAPDEDANWRRILNGTPGAVPFK